MKLAKWGNSLGIRIPAAMIRKEKLKEGDPITIQFRGDQVLEISRDLRRVKAIETIQKLARPMPVEFHFDRMDANER